jgi:hypothetical protein
MARGRLLKSKIKEAKAISQALRIGWQKADTKESWQAGLKEHLGRMLDKLDPIEVTAIMGVAAIIKEGIEWSEEITTNKTLLSLIGFGSPILWILYLLPDYEEQQKKIQEALDTPSAEIIQWFIAIAIACLIVRHFDALIGATRDIVGMAKLLIGSALVG